MNDVIVKINKSTRDVTLNKSFIGVDGENLVENLIFTFTDSFVDGEGRLEYIVDNAKYFINLEKENEKYFIKVSKVITKSGNIPMQLVIQKSIDDDTLIFKSEIFEIYCKKSIDAIDYAPDGEGSTLKDYVKFTDYATLTKTGVIKCGNGLFTINGVTRSEVINYSEYEDLEDYYFISKGTLENVLAGKNLITNNSYATNNSGGIIKLGNNFNLINGKASVNSLSYSSYTNASSNIFISKGTLENVIAGKKLINNTDYATLTKSGVIKLGNGFLLINEISSANILSYSDYQNTNNNYFISKGTLENVLSGKGYITDISGKLDTSSVKDEYSTNPNDIYNVTYINEIIGDIPSVLDSINGEVI